MTDKLDSFEKIINLMENAATEGEAQAAAAAFRRLLLKENLTEDEVRARISDNKVEEHTIDYFMPSRHGQWYGEQYAKMITVIAQHNLCFYAQFNMRFGTLVGRPKNVELVKKLFEAFKHSVQKQAKVAKRQVPSWQREDFTKSFYEGAAHGLRVKYVLEQMSDSANEKALVVTETDTARSTLEKMFGEIGDTVTKTQVVNNAAYNAGVKFGMAYGLEELDG